MIVKILDIETGNVGWLDGVKTVGDSWWLEGDGSCDCNRALVNDGVGMPECSLERYFIIDIVKSPSGNEKNDYTYDKDIVTEYNNYYSEELVSECLRILTRNEKINEILK